jgi:hypothetical protein
LNLLGLYVKMGKIEKMGKLSKTNSFLYNEIKGCRMKEFRLLSLLLVATLFVQNADATLLPYSSHYQGRSYFNDAGVAGYVDFAVYDTLGPHGNEWVGAGFAAPGTGQYIYAYQIFNNVGSTAIGSFTIMGKDDPPTLHHLSDLATMGSQNPWENFPLITAGVEPSGTKFNLGDPNSSTPTQATWEFWGLTDPTLVAGEYSWFLIFSSSHDWVQGKYQMGTAGGLPVTSNPEPGSITLLGIGGAMTLIRTRKKSCRT